MSGMPNKLTPAIARAAIAGMELQKSQIDQKIRELREMLEPSLMPGSRPASVSVNRPKRRTMTAAGRRAISLAQKRRWAAAKRAA